MRIFLNFILLLIIALIPSLLATSCQNEDDIDAIFNGKTWFITGGCINGTNITGEELKSIYANSNSFFLTFSASTFGGVLVAGSNVSGTWKADGKDQSIYLNFQSESNVNLSPLSSNIYNVLKNAQHYSGDVNVLKIMQDNYNFIRLSSQRNTSNF
ncbi:MAG: DUF4847 family protein [Bacteroidaceae bacterium]|nr:DUF4847 family protein [Bacteroidaceae bacterium]